MTIARSLSFAALSILPLAALACGSSSTSGTGASSPSSSHAGSSSGSSSGATTSSGSGGGAGGSSPSSSSSGMPCPAGTTYGGGETAVPEASVTAKIVDETGAPMAAGQPVYLCGINICPSTNKTDATGGVLISYSASGTGEPKKPALKVGDAITYAEIAIPVQGGTTDLTSGGTKVINTAKLAGKPGAALTPGTSAVSGDVTLTLAAGAYVDINPLVYTTTDSQMFRAVNIPIANESPWLASSGKNDFALLYGVGPAETPICPGAKVTVALPHANMTPNDLNWAPNAAVEFWIMTVDVEQKYAPYAGWAKMSDGTVSNDGTSISTTDGQGFIYLQTFAVRLAQ